MTIAASYRLTTTQHQALQRVESGGLETDGRCGFVSSAQSGDLLRFAMVEGRLLRFRSRRLCRSSAPVSLSAARHDAGMLFTVAAETSASVRLLLPSGTTGCLVNGQPSEPQALSWVGDSLYLQLQLGPGRHSIRAEG